MHCYSRTPPLSHRNTGYGFNVGGSVGGELGCCQSNKKKFTCFGAIGGGLSLATPGKTEVDLVGAITFTLLRDIGDVSGHALTAGLSVGDKSIAAVWGVGSDAETALELQQNAQDEGTSVCAEGHKVDGVCEQDGAGFIDKMMSTAFVGVTVSVSGSIKDIIKDGFTKPAIKPKFSGSIVCRVLRSNPGSADCAMLERSYTNDSSPEPLLGRANGTQDVGYAHGWPLDPGFNGETSPPSPPPKPKTPDNPYCQVVIFYDGGSPRTEARSPSISHGSPMSLPCLITRRPVSPTIDD